MVFSTAYPRIRVGSLAALTRSHLIGDHQNALTKEQITETMDPRPKTKGLGFFSEFLPFVIKLHGGVINLRPAFTVKRVNSWDFPATFGKINKAIKNYFA